MKCPAGPAAGHLLTTLPHVLRGAQEGALPGEAYPSDRRDTIRLNHGVENRRIACHVLCIRRPTPGHREGDGRGQREWSSVLMTRWMPFLYLCTAQGPVVRWYGAIQSSGICDVAGVLMRDVRISRGVSTVKVGLGLLRDMYAASHDLMIPTGSLPGMRSNPESDAAPLMSHHPCA